MKESDVLTKRKLEEAQGECDKVNGQLQDSIVKIQEQINMIEGLQKEINETKEQLVEKEKKIKELE